MLTSAKTIAQAAGIVIVPSAVPPPTCSTWLGLVDTSYRRADAVCNTELVAESSSFRLRAIDALSAIEVWSSLGSEVRQHCVDVLGPRLAIDADQCWVRRQYAPGSAPARHRPHSWHQDGALGFDFLLAGDAVFPDDALLHMVTCWIALTPCGLDAPGLELVTDRVDRLLSPAALADGAVEERWPMSRRARPVLETGDALIFDGGVPHRTHVIEAMAMTRTSIELRCFRADAIPDRIAGDELVEVAQGAIVGGP